MQLARGRIQVFCHGSHGEDVNAYARIWVSCHGSYGEDVNGYARIRVSWHDSHGMALMVKMCLRLLLRLLPHFPLASNAKRCLVLRSGTVDLRSAVHVITDGQPVIQPAGNLERRIGKERRNENVDRIMHMLDQHG